MNDFFIGYRAYRNNYLYGEGGYIVICSCGLNGIAAAILNKVNEQIKEGEDKVDMVVITSLTILDPLTAVQLSDNYENVLRIEDNGNSATEQ